MVYWRRFDSTLVYLRWARRGGICIYGDRMTWQAALETEVSRTKHARYRWLCSDANPDAETREGYRALMIRRATGEPDPPAPEPIVALAAVAQVASQGPPEVDPWLVLIRACEYHNPACCSHPAPFCSLYVKNVTREDCIACLDVRGIRPTEEACSGSL
jgi:hypothetical protein